ncbi:MAG: hypothetical protein GY946_22000 [bacterium]|nr:hypothetical protein [bacterium]
MSAHNYNIADKFETETERSKRLAELRERNLERDRIEAAESAPMSLDLIRAKMENPKRKGAKL